jgi:hypothetical protein
MTAFYEPREQVWLAAKAQKLREEAPMSFFAGVVDYIMFHANEEFADLHERTAWRFHLIAEDIDRVLARTRATAANHTR